MDADICIVMNTGSGSVDAGERRATLKTACDRFAGRFVTRTVEKGQSVEDAVARAVEDGFATIVAAGGDGTIAAVAGALAGTDRKMGVLAFGTFNYFARTLGIPEDVDDAIRLIVEGEARRFDVGDVNGRVFLNNASLGAYPAILDRREQIFKRWGRSRLLAHAITLATLMRFRSPLRGTLRVDGAERRIRTPLVFVSKNAGQLETMGLDGADCVRSGRFAVYVAPDTDRWGLVLFAARLALGLSEPREDFELLCGETVELETDQPMRLVARDGERERMKGPFRFGLHPKALTIILPPADAAA